MASQMRKSLCFLLWLDSLLTTDYSIVERPTLPMNVYRPS